MFGVLIAGVTRSRFHGEGKRSLGRPHEPREAAGATSILMAYRVLQPYHKLKPPGGTPTEELPGALPRKQSSDPASKAPTLYFNK